MNDNVELRILIGKAFNEVAKINQYLHDIDKRIKNTKKVKKAQLRASKRLSP